MESWKENINQLSKNLYELEISDHKGNNLEVSETFSELVGLCAQIRSSDNVMYFIGNGASAAMSSHLSADFAKNANMNTQTFTDLALITALANDISYEDVFAEPLKTRAKKGDMLIAISSSGNSPNILKAADVAIQKGMDVVTLSAMSGGNSLRKKGHYNFYIPAKTYGYAETGHAAILHYWKDCFN